MGHKVVQWGLGAIGMQVVRATIHHPGVDLVGVISSSAAASGRDAGELCGLEASGVVVTQALEDLANLDGRVDCIVYSPATPHVDHLVRVLAAGINVVTPLGEFQRAWNMAVGSRQALQDACRAGRSTLHVTGLLPGLISGPLPIALASVERRLECLEISEFIDLSACTRGELIFDRWGFGRASSDPAPVDGRLSVLSAAACLDLIADSLSLPIDSVETVEQHAVATRRLELAAGVVEPGTIAARRLSAVALRDGRPILRVQATWSCGANLDPPWPTSQTGWRIHVEGDAPLDISVSVPDLIDRFPRYVANRLVNSVPAVCGGPEGIVSFLELPHVVPLL